MPTAQVKLELTKGSNTLTFTRNTTRELVFKEFFLYPKDPVKLRVYVGKHYYFVTNNHIVRS